MLVGSLACLAIHPNFGPLVSDPKVPFHGALVWVGCLGIRFAHRYGKLTSVCNSRDPLAAIPFSGTRGKDGRGEGEREARDDESFHGSMPHSGDAVDALNLTITGRRAFDTTMRADRAGAQYPLLKRRLFETATSNAKHFIAFKVKSLTDRYDVDRDAPRAGFGVAGRDKGEREARGNQDLHWVSSFVG